LRRWIESLSDRAEFALVITVSFGYFIVSAVASLVLGRNEFELTTRSTIVAIAVEAALLLCVVAILRVRGKPFGRLGFRFSWGALLSAIPLFIASFFLYWFAWAFALSISPRVAQMQPPHMWASASVWLMIPSILVNSLFEESVVAGYVVSALEPNGAAFAITASTLIRFAYHVYQGPIASLSVLPMGLLFATVYWRSRNLWQLMTAHTIANLITFFLTSR